MVTAILLAGGSGSRFGSDKPKQFLEIDGCTVLEHSIRIFQQCEQVDRIVIVTRQDFIDEVRHISTSYPKVWDIRPGGKERYHSTLSALEVCTAPDDILLIHDAVRPFVSQEIIHRCIQTLHEYDACGVAVPCTDTTVRVDADDCIVETLPRHTLRNMQTPQGFRQHILRTAFDLGLKDPDFQPTDDCGVVRDYLPGVPIKIVAGDSSNIKITYPQDLQRFVR